MIEWYWVVVSGIVCFVAGAALCYAGLKNGLEERVDAAWKEGVEEGQKVVDDIRKEIKELKDKLPG